MNWEKGTNVHARLMTGKCLMQIFDNSHLHTYILLIDMNQDVERVVSALLVLMARGPDKC